MTQSQTISFLTDHMGMYMHEKGKENEIVTACSHVYTITCYTCTPSIEVMKIHELKENNRIFQDRKRKMTKKCLRFFVVTRFVCFQMC